MKVSVTLSANAGIAIHIGGHRIWVDALHAVKQKGFSTLTGDLRRRMLEHEAFFQPDHICYTHCHPDHFSEKLTDAALCLWPSAKVLAPEGKYGCMSGREWSLEARDLKLRFIRLPHEGAQYASVMHYGIIITLDDRNILIPGDCEVASPALLEAVGDLPIHLMLLDFPWLTLRRGAEFLKTHFPDVPKIVYHLPFAEDDTMGYRAVTQRRLADFPEARMLCDPMQSLTMEI